MEAKGLYDPAFEHDGCGIGAVVDIAASCGEEQWGEGSWAGVSSGL